MNNRKYELLIQLVRVDTSGIYARLGLQLTHSNPNFER